jgi:hypothetical protein
VIRSDRDRSRCHSRLLSRSVLIRALGKISMHQVYRHRTFADCGGNPFHTSCSRVANRKDSWNAGFEHEWGPFQRPLIPTRERSKIGAGDDKSPIVQDEGIFEPFCPWCCSGHHKNVPNGTGFRFSERVFSPFDMLKVSGAPKPCDPSPIVNLNPGVRLNTSNQGTET